VNIFIVDDDESTRYMLREIIEDNEAGRVVGEADCGSKIDHHLLQSLKTDVLLIDLLMPKSDGIEIIHQLKNSPFDGIIIMISQVSSKEMISKAYLRGIEYYILKPINQIEVLSILHKVSEKILLKRTVDTIQQSLRLVTSPRPVLQQTAGKENASVTIVKHVLNELGLTGEPGYHDLVEIVNIMRELDNHRTLTHESPKLKEIYTLLALRRLGLTEVNAQVNREIKACEQRIRRSIIHSIIHIASIGLTDFSNPVFEKYAPKFFDFQEVRRVMKELEKDNLQVNHISVNTKKFIQALYLETIL
jgi:two-component system response regulator YcbB